MTVRLATAEDFSAIAAVQRRAVDQCLRPLYDGGAIDRWLAAIDEEKFVRVANAGETILVVGEEKVVGFCSYHAEMSLLGMWYVDPEVMGRGVGSALLSAAEEGLAEEGCLTATTEASLFARPHFEARGWKPVEEVEKPAFGALMRVTRMEKRVQ